jgi:hypothetical protein
MEQGQKFGNPVLWNIALSEGTTEDQMNYAQIRSQNVALPAGDGICRR